MMEAIVPAQLAFLTLYNPSLSSSDDTIHEQILYYYSSDASKARTAERSVGEHEERNEQLRQIGLAQGMVQFARAFSDGQSIDSIDSERSRIVLHEVESDWWLLASIDLTREATIRGEVKSRGPGLEKTTIDYMSREVCPQDLLLQQLLRAHAIFLLHHGPSLEEIYQRIGRRKLCNALERFWGKFIRSWDVLLHGNPAVDIYNGLKLAAGGELGIGVGEEEWGSGEREVLEGFISRTDGLIDIMVSRFGEPPEGLQTEYKKALVLKGKVHAKVVPWLGTNAPLGPADGVVFSGTSAITRSSLRNISAWIEWIYRFGYSTYGVRDNPHATCRRRKKPASLEEQETVSRDEVREILPQIFDECRPLQSPNKVTDTIKIPPPILAPRGFSSVGHGHREPNSSRRDPGSTSTNGTDTMMKYLTLGLYGSSWVLPATTSPSAIAQPTKGASDPQGKASIDHRKRFATAQEESRGTFVIGLRGNLEDDEVAEDQETASDMEPGTEASRRIMVRSIHVELARNGIHGENHQEQGIRILHVKIRLILEDSSIYQHSDRVRVVIYVRQPFIFAFLYSSETSSLSLSSHYRSLHHQLGPLQRPLLLSTSPGNVRSRIWDATSPRTVGPTPNSQPIYDLIADISTLAIHTTIPNIPDQGPAIHTTTNSFLDPLCPWTRLEALNVHSQILASHAATRRRPTERERTSKTSRGWWVVWMRLPDTDDNGISREAVLIRKASDYEAPPARRSLFGRTTAPAEATGWVAARLAEGIGIDTSRYIEGLLNLSR